MSHFVLELGTEELPARFLASLERELKAVSYTHLTLPTKA